MAALSLLSLLSLPVLLPLLLLPRSATAFLGRSKPHPAAVRALSPPGTTERDVPRPYAGTSVAAALISMQPAEGAQYDGADKDNVIVDIVGQGPVLWSVSRWNQGDLSPRLAPRHPYAQTNLGHPPGAKGYSSDDPLDTATQAWRPDTEKGVVLATVAQNGVHWDDGAGEFYATVACVTDSQGFGYSMKTGQFGNSNPNMDVSVGKVGQKGEGNAPVAIAWFPYDEGWTGGYVDAPAEFSKRSKPQWVTPFSHSPDLPVDPSELLKWSPRGARLRLPGVHPFYDGMLFLTSTDPGKANNDINVLGAYSKANGKGWRIQAREDSSNDPTKLVESSEHMFAFLYVPFSATGLVGGNIDADGSVLRSAGDFEVNKVDTGKYSISIGGSKKQPTDGILLLQVFGRDEEDNKFAQHAFLSYNYTGSGDLLVEAHKLQYIRQGNVMDEVFPFVDCGFSFMWVDFKNPPTPEPAMYTGRLPVPQSSSLRFWSGFVVGVSMAVFLAALVASGVPHVRSALSSSTALSSFRVPSSLDFLNFRRPEALISTELEDEELLRGPYQPASS